MAADTDPRTELVEWDGEKAGLVISGSDVPLAALWESFQNGETFRDFLDRYPTIPIDTVLRILGIAGELLSAWPWDSDEEQYRAYANALAESDIRFTSGIVEFLPGVRGGKLLSRPSANRIDILWACIRDGYTPKQIRYSYPDVTRTELQKLAGLASQLFEKGLVPSEAPHLSRQRRADRGEGTSS